ncbi:uncharacterized protein LOC101218989 [Cucumis sativus]|uniref:Uncharacterized protein n=1 Tax=Cucumis sativus TaxID=3659 RepID=A0A0A0LPS1_CUCSA|nr:uncharacterized protein LOC101218989 [Cucumis sativus]KGN63813.1 hypothetical protein Csa_013143 [Cucumis sativus]
MPLTITNGGATVGTSGGILYRTFTRTPSNYFLFRRNALFHPSKEARTLHLVQAKKSSFRTGRFDSKNRKSSTTIKEQEEEEERNRTAGVEMGSPVVENAGVVFDVDENLPQLPGLQPDFWEGPQWDAFGFFLEYLWAFGIVFAIIACGIAVTTYNEGATDFKETPAYKESVQTREILEPEASNPDVFESNPTEVAPSLE